jgi:hypothetical protein
MTNWDVVLDVLEEYDKDTTRVGVYDAPVGGNLLYMTTVPAWPPRRRSTKPDLPPGSPVDEETVKWWLSE